MDEPRATPDRGGRVLAVVATAFLAVVGFGVLGFVGLITRAPFFGEQPTSAEIAQATAYHVAALVCLVVPPVVAACLLGWRGALVTLGAEVVVVGLGLGLLLGS
jgi:hypothetical protein